MTLEEAEKLAMKQRDVPLYEALHLVCKRIPSVFGCDQPPVSEREEIEARSWRLAGVPFWDGDENRGGPE